MNITMVSNLLETLMIVGFGISGRFSIYKSYVSGTAKGKSLQFEFFYMAGIHIWDCKEVSFILSCNHSL